MNKILFLFISIIFSQNFGFDNLNSHIKYFGEHPLHNWIGISENIFCSLNCNNNECYINISCPLESFNSGNDNRDSNMLYYTESLIFPNVTFKSNKFILNNFNDQFKIYGILNFHGIDKNINSNINIINKDNYLIGSTQFKLSLNDFNIDHPKLLFFSISDTITLDINLKFLKKD